MHANKTAFRYLMLKFLFAFYLCFYTTNRSPHSATLSNQWWKVVYSSSISLKDNDLGWPWKMQGLYVQAIMIILMRIFAGFKWRGTSNECGLV